jgi:pilus assembly protein CpaB
LLLRGRRWSPVSKVFAVLAVASGLAAFGVVRGYELRLQRLHPAVGPTVEIVEAARPLGRGTTLTEDMVRSASVPTAFRQPGAFGSTRQVIGRTLISDLAEGEALTRTRIGIEGGPVAAQVPSGLRAFTIASGMPSRAVHAGDRVDVLATFGGPHPHTETVASGLEVLMVLAGDEGDPALSSSSDSPSLVLLVDPDVAERLAYAASFGTFSISIDPTDLPAAG